MYIADADCTGKASAFAGFFVEGEISTMELSKVYFTTFKTSFRENLLQKLNRLIKTAGMGNIDFTDKYAAIKIHFGEYGNLAFLRPNYARVVADAVKELGGKPFLTDCNTLYVGSRKNALDHIETAYMNGFTPYATGCHVIIADGLKGTDEVLVPVDGEYVKEAKIGRGLMDADILISLTHFKGHEAAGFGGALKNIGMGGGSRAGKMEMHSAGKPFAVQKRCVGCGFCTRVCAHDAITITDKKAFIDHNKCVGCGRCIGVCPKDAVTAPNDETNDILNCKIAEYTYAVCKDRPCFHIALICDVSPYCDCHGENDIPIIPNVGMLASFDPVALDVACADLCNQQPVIDGSVLGDHIKKQEEHKHFDHDEDYFGLTHPDTNWKSSIKHAVKIGLGSDQYELIKI
ncbi:Ferredoxin [uncultured Roseburia sp.]|nr:Ferredoxin [uncultured Roseburia sp.]